MKTKNITAAILAALILIGTTVSASAKTLILSGDIDHDGVITSNDAISVLRSSVDDEQIRNTVFKRADVDGDSAITSKDAMTILRQSIGFDEISQSASESSYDVNDGINDFSAELFKRCYDKSGKNTLVSPLSVYTALSMLNNGADGITQQEMLDVLGNGVNSTENINSYIHDYMDTINSGNILKIANSIFAIDQPNIYISPDFKNTVQTEYFAEIFNGPANNDTVKKINNWVSDNTDKMIPSIISKIPEDSICILLNAVAFDGAWKDKYEKSDIWKRPFENFDGTQSMVEFLNSEESFYISDDKAIGFIKEYEPRKSESGNEKYAFVAILPDENIGIDEYISQMDDSTIKELVSCKNYRRVDVGIPKFKFDCTYSMNNMLSDMGMESAFLDNADFSKLAFLDSSNNPVSTSINSVVHKSFIELDEHGTKAAAATAIIDRPTAVAPANDRIILDRPFIFSIYDMKNNVPVFIGTVCSL